MNFAGVANIHFVVGIWLNYGQWGLRENFLGEGVGESIFSLINMAQERKHSFSSAGCYCVDRECLNCDAYLVGVCERTN